MGEDNKEVVEAKQEKNKNSKQKLIAAFLAGFILVFLVVIMAVSCGNKDKTDKNETETIAYETPTAVADVETNQTIDISVTRGSEKEEKSTKESEEKTSLADESAEAKGSIEETATEKTAADETTVKETTVKETTIKETTVEETTAKETSAKATENEETAARETSAKETQKETTAEETPAETTLEETASESQTAPKTESGTPYENHGKLRVEGTNIVDSKGNPYQLKGVSTHGIAWFPDYVNKQAFQTMRDEWGISIVRLAMYTDEYAGYCNGGDQNYLKQLIDRGVQAATELGLYVIIDWHVLNDKYPSVHQDEAIKFFTEISKKYASYGNVIYEICNEPNSGPSWSDIKAYAEKVIPVIRANCDNIIIVGTPTWSQDVDQAAANPITGQKNIMYALHFYAATHKDFLWNRMVAAVNAGLPIFVSEYGICDASGNGSYDENSANTWMAYMDKLNISSCIWNLSNKSESSALINSSCAKVYGWSEGDLSGEGKWFVNMLHGKAVGSIDVDVSPSAQQTQQQTEYIAPTTQAAVAASEGNCEVSAQNTNSWGDSSQGYYMQLDVSLKNNGSDAVTGWKIILTFSGEIAVDSSWNGTCTVSGKTITITSDADWNATISPGSNIAPGLIVKSSSEVKLVSAKLK